MSELREHRWSVISERGGEASALVYEEAARLRRQLADEKLSGLCIVTDEAAGRLQTQRESEPTPGQSAPVLSR